MSQLDAILENASNNTAGVYSLSGETLAVLFYALSFVQSLNAWKDFPDEPLTDSQIDQIVELVDWANDEIMRELNVTPVGATMIWHTVTPPANWLFCVGGLEQVDEWPELFALWGYKYGGSGSQFQMPAFTDHSPMGAGGDVVALDDYEGARTHTLTTAQIPSHSHNLKIGTAAGSGGHPHANTNQANPIATYAAVDVAGGGEAHNNLSPVFGVFFIVYAGKHVT